MAFSAALAFAQDDLPSWNNGTLWAEQPMYFQYIFALDRLKTLAPQHPEWRTKDPCTSLLKGDLKGALSDRPSWQYWTKAQ